MHYRFLIYISIPLPPSPPSSLTRGAGPRAHMHALVFPHHSTPQSSTPDSIQCKPDPT